MPYQERVEEGRRADLTDALVETYLDRVPLDAEGNVHVAMVRLEVEAKKTG